MVQKAEAGHLRCEQAWESEVEVESERVGRSRGLRPGGWAWEALYLGAYLQLVCNFYLLKDCVAGGERLWAHTVQIPVLLCPLSGRCVTLGRAAFSWPQFLYVYKCRRCAPARCSGELLRVL